MLTFGNVRQVLANSKVGNTTNKSRPKKAHVLTCLFLIVRGNSKHLQAELIFPYFNVIAIYNLVSNHRQHWVV